MPELYRKPAVLHKLLRTLRATSPNKEPLHAHPAACYTSLLLTIDTTGQHHRFAAAFRILEDVISARAFPSAATAIVYRGKLVALHGLGHHTFDAASPAVTADSVFDIASVSKVVATTTMAALLYERGLLQLDALVADIVPEFRSDDLRRSDVSVRALLTHTSGLPAYIKLFEQTRDRDELIRLAIGTPLEADPGTRTSYSDIGFIMLGVILERLAEEPLDTFCRREIFKPLELNHTTFNPPSALRKDIVPTADDRKFRHKLVQGEVHDENTWVMRGVAGHAGLFSTGSDLARFAQCWLSGGAPILNAATIAEFTRQQPGTTRALGWDRPSPPSQAGQHFSPLSFGHLGFTGTSLWCDPSRQLAIVLLTNRVWPDSSNQAIKQIRPRFHDAIVESL
ncbi:MAG TPA: serine hydrolase domain-containing protein [Terriglobales bacterium]|nr:serine hydrolase domain-containing protein [Terriglobales bacterium]